MEIGLFAAFIAGMLSFLSPCVFPLVPPYLCYMAGVSMEDLKGSAVDDKKYQFAWSILIPAISFVLGFTVVFVLLGATATLLGQLLHEYMDWLTLFAGIAIIIMGLHFLGVFRFMFLSREVRFQPKTQKAGPIGAFVMGLAFAFGWTPCMGPVLGALYSYAGMRDTVSEGVVLLSMYSLGLGIPFLIAALFSSFFMVFLSKFKVHLGKIEKIMGLFLILVGIIFITGQMREISNWILEVLPVLGQIG